MLTAPQMRLAVSARRVMIFWSTLARLAHFIRALRFCSWAVSPISPNLSRGFDTDDQIHLDGPAPDLFRPAVWDQTRESPFARSAGPATQGRPLYRCYTIRRHGACYNTRNNRFRSRSDGRVKSLRSVGRRQVNVLCRRADAAWKALGKENYPAPHQFFNKNFN